MRILILGGTGEARQLASALHNRPDVTVVSSLAGRVSNPLLPVGAVRVGGFGGATGLASYLRSPSVDMLIDATHPFAATITEHAVSAAEQVGCPLIVLRRPGWPERDGWIRVPDIATAATVAADSPPGCVFLTTGRRDLAAFAPDTSHDYLVRTVEPPSCAMPPHTTLVLDRGPYPVEGELALMDSNDVRMLVTKDSGGTMTEAKLDAAQQRGIPVVVVDRPPLPEDVPAVETVEAIVSLLDNVAG